jgi:hypothetical protein
MTTTLEAVRAESLRMTVREAVRLCTAFLSEHEMLDSLRGGYLPTLRTKAEPMGVEEGRHNHAVRVVQEWVLDSGFSFFDGRHRGPANLLDRMAAKQ